jgi:DNA-binding transcriptional LysR family regulator
MAAQLEDRPSGLIRLTIPSSMERHLTSGIAEFQTRWPAVEFALNFTDRVVDLVGEGYDLAVRAGQLEDSTLRVRKIGEARRYLCASPGYLDRVGAPQRPEDLADHNCLIFRTHPGYNVWRFNVGGRSVDVRASGRFSANSGNALVNAARDSRGLILAPEWLVGSFLANGELVEVLPKHPPVPDRTPVYAVHPYQRFVPPKVKTYVDFLVNRYSKGYDWSRLQGDPNG